MLEKALCEEVLARAKKTGADFSEIYMSDDVNNNITYMDGKVEKSSSSRDRGVGIRILKGDKCVYAYGNDISRQGLLALADTVADAMGNSYVDVKDIVIKPKKIELINKILVPANTVDAKRKIDYLKRGYYSAKEYSDEIVQVIASIMDKTRHIFVANSEGIYTEDNLTYVRYMLNSIASDGKENQSGYKAPGNHSGYEFIDGLNFEKLGEKVSKQAVTMLHAENCPAGKMPVIMDNGFGGVLFHEACGHSLEATAVGKGNSVFCGKLGEQIANPKVTAIDDGTMVNEWGSINTNDEGEAPQKITLIENGILKSYMIDKLGSRRMNMSTTGSGRRQNYCYAPTSRMTNTYIANGTDTREDIFSSVEYGLYAKEMGGGSVNPVTGEFNFAVSEGYIVKNGKIDRPVRGATLIGKGKDVLMNIDMVSDNMAMAQGMCGSASGSIPTNVGQPLLRINQITVGGKE